MKKTLLFILICCFSAGCAYHPIETPFENTPSAKPELPTFKAIPYVAQAVNKFDNYYNVTFTNTKIICNKDIKLLKPMYDDINFIQDSKTSGTFFFNNNPSNGMISAFDEISVTIDSDGKFNETKKGLPFCIGNKYSGFFQIGAKIDARFTNTGFKGTFTDIMYSGPYPGKDKHIKTTPYCQVIYDFVGTKRFVPRINPTSTLEGEYKSIVTKNHSTCTKPVQILSDNYFIVNNIFLSKDYYYLKIGSLTAYQLPITNETITVDATGNSGDKHVLNRTITPDKLVLTISIYRDFHKCTESYRIEGYKRFEESDGKDTTVDGIYNVWMPMLSMTCQGQPSMSGIHMNVLKISDSKVVIILGGRVFTVTLDGNKRFTAKISTGTTIGVSHTLKDVELGPNNIDGLLITEYSFPAMNGNPAETCNIIYGLSGDKLNKHK